MTTAYTPSASAEHAAENEVVLDVRDLRIRANDGTEILDRKSVV